MKAKSKRQVNHAGYRLAVKKAKDVKFVESGRHFVTKYDATTFAQSKYPGCKHHIYGVRVDSSPIELSVERSTEKKSPANGRR